MFVDAVQILTSTVIECYRSNLKESAFKFATILMKSDYRHQVILVFMSIISVNNILKRLCLLKIDEKYRKKIESVIRKSPRAGSLSDETITKTEPCPYCGLDLLLTSLICTNCKNTIPFCIASVSEHF